MKQATAFPLAWPDHMPRSRTPRDAGRFKTSLAGALRNVKDSLARFASDSGKSISGVVISSNVTLGNEKPADPGVSIWFAWDGLQVCIPVDRYSSVAANLQAIHHIIEARRTEIRHGTLALVRATFTGFQALPAPGAASRRHWRDVLAFPAEATVTERGQIEAAFRVAAKKAHPDHGGTAEAMAEVNAARAAALAEIGGRP